MLNLLMAIVWLIVGLALIVWQAAHAENHTLTIFGSGVSIGWAGVMLAIYNVVRWWSSRSAGIWWKATNEAWRSREAEARRRNRPAEPPDPNFLFTDEPNPPPK
jgi:hypothetical protein